MKLYLVRHGETEWNALGKKQGRTDIPLNEVGERQAEELAERLKDVQFDACVASPLRRAYRTAEIVTRGKCKINVDERLIERGFGEFEGTLNKDWAEMTGGADVWDRKLNYGERGMETVQEILARARSFLDDVKKNYAEDAKLLIVAHGSLLKALHFVIVGYDDSTDFHAFHFGNAEMKEYEV